MNLFSRLTTHRRDRGRFFTAIVVSLLLCIHAAYAEEDFSVTAAMQQALHENQDYELDRQAWLLAIQQLEREGALHVDVAGRGTLRRPGETGDLRPSASSVVGIEVEDYELELPVHYDFHAEAWRVGVDITGLLGDTLALGAGFGYDQNVEIEEDVFSDVSEFYFEAEQQILPRPVRDEDLSRERDFLEIDKEFRESRDDLLFSVFDAYVSTLRAQRNAEDLEFRVEEQERELDRLRQEVEAGEKALREELDAEEQLFELRLDLEDARYDLKKALNDLARATGLTEEVELHALSWEPDLAFHDPLLLAVEYEQALRIGRASRFDYRIAGLELRLREKDVQRAERQRGWRLSTSAGVDVSSAEEWQPNLTASISAGRALVDPSSELDLKDRTLQLERARRTVEITANVLERELHAVLRELERAQTGVEQADRRHERHMAATERAERELDRGIITDRDLERQNHAERQSAYDSKLARFRLQRAQLDLLVAVGGDLLAELKGLERTEQP